MLGTCMVHAGTAGTAVRVLGNMWSQAFTEDRRIIAEKIREYVQATRVPDYATLGRECPDQVDTIETAITYVEDPDYITNRAESLLITAKQRLLKKAGEKCLQAGEGNLNVDIALDTTFGELANIYTGGVEMATLNDLADEFIADYLEKEKQEYALTGVPTGIPGVDMATGGLKFEQISILGARTRHGKSALALNYIAIRAASPPFNYPVLVIGHEMPRQAYKRRMVCAQARLDYNTVFQGRLRTHTKERAFQTAEELRQLPITILDSPNPSPSELMAHVMSWRQQQDRPGLVIVDHLHNEHIPGWRGQTNEMYAQISAQWKSAMRISGCAGLVLAQLNRGAAGHPPKLEQLRDSGAIEQDASAVMLLYRPGVEDDNQPANSAQIGLAKNSQGPLAYDYLHFTGYSMSFLPWDPHNHTERTDQDMRNVENHEINDQRNDGPATQSEENFL